MLSTLYKNHAMFVKVINLKKLPKVFTGKMEGGAFTFFLDVHLKKKNRRKRIVQIYGPDSLTIISMCVNRHVITVHCQTSTAVSTVDALLAETWCISFEFE